MTIPLRYKLWDILLNLVLNVTTAKHDNEHFHQPDNLYYQQLFLNISNHDQHSFEELYNQESGYIYGYLLKMTKSIPIATELLQSTFIMLWNERKYLNKVNAPRPYLFKIAVRLTYKYLTNSGNRNKILDISELSNLLQEPIETSEHQQIKNHLQVVLAKIEALPEQQKNVITLKVFEGLSNREISEKLKISVSAVENYLFKARQKLKPLKENE